VEAEVAAEAEDEDKDVGVNGWLGPELVLMLGLLTLAAVLGSGPM
jgi:hypothetical protein